MTSDDDHGEPRFIDRFFETVCRFNPLFALLLTMEILFVLLGGIAFPYNAPGSGGRVVLYVTMAVNAPILVAAAGLIYVCRRGGRYRDG